MLLVLFCLVFAVLAIYAAVSDLATMTIPNWVSIVLAAAFAPAAAAAGLSIPEVGAHLASGALALTIGAALFYMGVFGGGDAKLIAAISIWTGFSGGAPFVMATAVCGGLLALTLIVLRRSPVAAQASAPWAKRLMSPTEGAPYAVAIAGGAFLSASSSPVLAAAMGRLAAA